MEIVFVLIGAAVAVFWYVKLKSKTVSGSLPNKFIVVDIETTGLDPKKDEIIEIAAIKVNLDSNIHTTFDTLIKPTVKLPAKIKKITGITDEMLDSEADSLKSAIPVYVEALKKLYGNPH